MFLSFRLIRYIFLISLFILSSSGASFASHSHFLGGDEPILPYKKMSISILSENDAYFDSTVDKYYTAGTRIAFSTREMDFNGSDGVNHPILKKISRLGFLRSMSVAKFNIHLGQEIYTPKEKLEYPAEKDRSYAGYLYTAIGLTNRNNKVEERLWVNLGVVGPYSLAQESQDFIHSMIGGNSKLPGWGTQIGNEPIINIHYGLSRKFTVFDSFIVSLDSIVSGGLALGNADTHARLDARIRIGHNLDADFGVPKINKSYNASTPYSNAFSAYIFAGTGGSAIGKNIFISGNTFGSKTKLNIRHFVGDFEAGFAVLYKGCRLSYVWTHTSKEFSSQDANTNIGSILLDIAF